MTEACEACLAGDGHEQCTDALCGCEACRTKARGSAAYGTFGHLPRWTVDKDTQRWDEVDTAMAFRKPNGDTIAIMRTAMCPTCGHAAVLFLADGDLVSYIQPRHASCDIN